MESRPSDSIKDDSSFVNSNKCQVCDKTFTLRIRKKIACDLCNGAFCVDHCIKEISIKQGEQTFDRIICDRCYQKYKKQECSEALNNEITSLEEELLRAKNAAERVEREIFDKTSNINSLENAFENRKNELSHNNKIHNEEIKENEEKIKELEQIYENIEKNLMLRSQELSEAETKYKNSYVDIEEIRKNILDVKIKKKQLTDQLITSRQKVRYCIEFPKTNNVLCQKCKDELNKVYQERTAQDKSLDESLSVYEFPTALDSVRDMKESLNVLIVDPNNKTKCVIS